MLQSLVRILILGVLGYGIYRVVPAVAPTVQESLNKPEIANLPLIEKGKGYLNEYSNEEGSDKKLFTLDDKGMVLGALVDKARESVAERVQEDVSKAKEGAKEVANEQFCKTVLKTLEEECGKYYCSE